MRSISDLASAYWRRATTLAVSTTCAWTVSEYLVPDAAPMTTWNWPGETGRSAGSWITTTFPSDSAVLRLCSSYGA